MTKIRPTCDGRRRAPLTGARCQVERGTECSPSEQSMSQPKPRRSFRGTIAPPHTRENPEPSPILARGEARKGGGVVPTPPARCPHEPPGKVPLRATTAVRPGDAVIVKNKGKKNAATVLSAATDLMGIHKPRKKPPPPRHI